jgi:hypothetical protein
MTERTNDNEAAAAGQRRRDPDPHGQAAMLLVESLIHGLVSSSVISVEEAVEIVDTAAEVKIEIANDLGEAPETLQSSLTMLESISASLRQDIYRA